MIARLALLVALLAPLPLAGCGYSMVGYQGLHRENIETVSVAAVANATFDTDTADALTEALVRRIESATPYRVADVSRADTLLEVTLTQASRGATLRNPATGLVDEYLWSVTVDVKWKDLRTGRVLVTLENFSQAAAQYPTLGEGEFVASQSAAEGLAAAIVGELQSRW